MNVFEATLDTRHQNGVIGTITQFDNATLELRVVTDGVIDEAWDNPQFELIAMKRDANAVREVDQDRFTILSKEEHRVQIELKEQFLTCRGTVKMQLVVKDGSRESTTLFYLVVSQSLDRDIIESHMDVKVLDDLEAYIQTGREVIYEAQEIVTGLKDDMSEFNAVSSEKEADRQASELNRASKELIRIDNEEDRVANEQVRVANEEIRVNNEEERVQNEQDRVTNETTRRLAETTRIAQERARQDAELQRNAIFEENENLRKDGEKTRIANENERKKKFESWEGRETTRLKSEENRIIQEQERVINEEERQRQEQMRQNQEDYRQRTYTQFNEAEASRVNKELQRQSAEEERVTAEANRQSNYVESENERDRQYAEAEEVRNNAFEQNEANRQLEYTQAERERVESEELRKSYERERQTAEAQRQTQEQQRVQNEQGRIDRFNQEIERAEAAITEVINNAISAIETTTANADEIITEAESTIQGIEERAEACLPIIEDSATAKVDYMGNEHKSIKDARDADVDWILGEVNTTHYEGQHITATDTIEGRSKNAVLKGQTLVNHLNLRDNPSFHGGYSSVDSNGVITVIGRDTWTNAFIKGFVKPDTTYLVIVDVLSNTLTTGFTVLSSGADSSSSNLVSGGSKINGGETGRFFFKATTKNTLDGIYCVRSFSELNNSGEIKYKIMVIEYQEGMENWDIPYFEGMQSVKMPILTTTGKNLIHVSKGYLPFRENEGITISRDEINQTITLNGTSTIDNNCFELAPINNLKILKGETYTITAYLISGVASGNYSFRLNDKGWSNAISTIIGGRLSNTKTYVEDALYTDSSVRIDTGATFENAVFKVQFEKNTTSTSYEPHKSNILTTAGKNLFNMNRPYDAITDSQATVIQNTDQITVSSAESGAYVSANFILDKDFFAGKTVTGSCLYESDEKGIGMVQIVYQDGDGEHHYQWIRTPRTFTFPNSFIGDVMLSVSANNTGTPQSNTVTVKNIQLELGSTATSYEPYSEVVLRGIGDVKDELDLMTGEVTERIAIESLKDINWIYRNDGDGSSTISFNGTLKELSVGTQSKAEAFCDGFIIDNSSANGVEGFGIENNSKIIYLEIKREKLNGLTASDLITYLTEKDYKIIYRKSNYTIKTVDLSDNVVYSYKDTTHYTCSSEDGSLIPTLSIDVPTNLPALVSKQRATIESQKEQIATLETENEQLIAQNELQDVEIALNQDAINFILFQAMNMNQKTKGVNMMAAYFANQILKGKLDYALVVSRYPEYKEDIDTILIAEGKQDLIK